MPSAAARVFRDTLVLLALGALAPSLYAQAIGPDIINSDHLDVARYGTDAAGTTTAYAVGAVTCNHGDLPAVVTSTTNNNLRPLIAQNMYRLKAYGIAPNTYQRFEQIGQGWVKRVGAPGSMNVASCGACTSGPSGTMGINCGDVYGTAFNGSQGLLGPRSMVNAPLGSTTSGAGSATGDSVTRGRIQVPTADVTTQPAGTRFYVETVHLLPDDAQYVRTGATVAVNAMNNAASQEVNIGGGTGTPALLGALNLQAPALQRWRDADPGVVIVTVDDDSTPNPRAANTFIRTRFQVAARVTSIGGGQWRYEYAVFNLNSARGCGAFVLPLDASLPASSFSFRHPLSHSGELYSNAPWTPTRNGPSITFATDPFVINANANAVRWGTTYNIGFTTTRPPRTGIGQLTLFAPGSGPAQLAVPGLPVPGAACSADFNQDGDVGTDQDIEAFFACLSGNCCAACPANADFNGDGDVGTDADIESFFRVLAGGNC